MDTGQGCGAVLEKWQKAITCPDLKGQEEGWGNQNPARIWLEQQLQEKLWVSSRNPDPSSLTHTHTHLTFLQAKAAEPMLDRDRAVCLSGYRAQVRGTSEKPSLVSLLRLSWANLLIISYFMFLSILISGKCPKGRKYQLIHYWARTYLKPLYVGSHSCKLIILF